MQHLGIKEKAVRFQGNWRDREESMPDTYLREAQTLVLRAQERCLGYLRDGGDIMRLVGAPLTAMSGEEENAESERKGRAMACVFEGVAAASVPPAFLDDAFGLNAEFKGNRGSSTAGRSGGRTRTHRRHGVQWGRDGSRGGEEAGREECRRNPG